ncbi:MAG: hypothetical protein IIY83_03610 [Lachnospiraceae bacterium]|nr:hypothetical protein [Lachnospiraceae bacterium]
MEVNRELLQQIDGLELPESNRRWRAAMKAAEWNVCADRDRLAVKSWKETAGEDIQIRRAKLFKEIVENLPISILEFDQLAGRPTKNVIGCCAAIDVAGDYIPDLREDTDVLGVTLDASAHVDRETIEALRESVRTFGGRTAPEMTYKAWEAVLGDWPKQAEAAKLKDPSLDTAIFGNCTSTVNFRKIFRVGLRGIIDEAQAHIDDFRANGGTDIDSLFFWQSSVIVLEAAITLAHRYSDLAAEMALAEPDSVRAAELAQISAACAKVPEHPAESFHEALQAMAIIGVCKCLEHPTHANPHWGRGDQYLYDFFMNDLKSGKITLERAAQLLADLIGRWGTQTFMASASLKESHQINFNINNMMIGGLNAEGEDCANELSYLMLHMVGLLKLSSPTVCLRWSDQTPNWLMDKAVRTNMATRGGIPLFENDRHVTESYVKDGIPLEEAVEWVGLGCIYPCLPTRAEHYGAEGVAAFNMGALMHLVLHNGVDINGVQTGLQTGDPREFKNIDEVYDAFMKQLKFLVGRIFYLADIARNIEFRYMRLPFLSSISVQGCMDDGRDLLIPMPCYSMYGISDRGIIDAADSMTAIRKLVFEDRTITMDELLQALDSNFEGPRGDEIRLMCLAAPKYGNDIPEVDQLASRISHDSATFIQEYDNSPFPHYIVAREGLAWHYFGGLGAGALPNGRKALEPLNDGALSPMRGCDTCGPTGVLRSALAAGFEDSYASALNQKFTASILEGQDSVQKLVDYTNAFMAAGGTHIQYNIVDTEQLRDAKVHPDEYQDLIVRIGGFSAYFVQLSGDIQDDVINRSEFSL